MKNNQLTDPYCKVALPTFNSTALVMGRSVSRIAWHLQQAAFLDDRAHASVTACDRGLDSYGHLRLAGAALGAIYGKAKTFPRQQADQVCGFVRHVSDRIGPSFLAKSNETLAEAAERAWNTCVDYEDVHGHEAVRAGQGCIAPIVGPLESKLRATLDEAENRWFELGRLLDEGVCPPDIARFASDWCSPRVWRVPKYAVCLKAQLEAWEGNIEMPKRQRFEDQTCGGFDWREELLGPVNHEPGGVMPSRYWLLDVSSKWHEVGLEVAVLEKRLTETASQRGVQIADHFVNSLEELFEIAVCAAGAGERLQVDVPQQMVKFEGREFPVTRRCVVIFSELMSHRHEDDSLSFSKIKERHPRLFKSHDKLDREIKKMPAELQELFRRKPSRGGGSWLEY